MEVPCTSSSFKDWPLDAASIGALISEVAGDYKRLGEELVLLDPQNSVRSDKDGMDQDEEQRHKMLQSASSIDGANEGNTSSDGKGGKEKRSFDAGVNMKTLVIELEHVRFWSLGFNLIYVCLWILIQPFYF